MHTNEGTVTSVRDEGAGKGGKGGTTERFNRGKNRNKEYLAGAPAGGELCEIGKRQKGKIPEKKRKKPDPQNQTRGQI